MTPFDTVFMCEYCGSKFTKLVHNCPSCGGPAIKVDSKLSNVTPVFSGDFRNMSATVNLDSTCTLINPVATINWRV